MSCDHEGVSFECKLNDGQLLELENAGMQTFVRLSSGDSGKNQSQGHGFRTGRWKSDPVVRHAGKSYYIQLQTAEGTYLLGIQKSEIRLLEGGPNLEDAEEIEL